MLFGALVFSAVAACAGPALADPRLDEIVYQPYVQNGVGELELRHGQQVGGATNGELTTVVEAAYGLNDRVSLSLVGAVHRDAGGPLIADRVGLESIVYLGQLPRLGVDTGLYLEYTHGLNGATDVLEGKLLMARSAGRFQGLVNLIVEEPLGAPRGEGFASYGYAASATWRTVGKLRLGLEAFGDLGDDHRALGRQGAYVGPQLKWEFRPCGAPAEVELDLGWLAAVGTDRAEARSQFRIGLEFEHHF